MYQADIKDVRKIQTYYINLDSHVDKKIRIEEILTHAGFENFSRLQAVENKVDGQIGLINTHVSLLSSLKVPFLLLEDDVDILNRDFELSIPKECDVLYLGNSVWGDFDGKARIGVKFEKVANDSRVLRIKNMLSTHAMLFLSQDYVDFCASELSKEIDAGRPTILRIDQFYARTQHKWGIFALNRPIFYQKNHSKSMTRNEKWTSHKLTNYKFRLQTLCVLILALLKLPNSK
jgi:hypothetical protein